MCGVITRHVSGKILIITTVDCDWVQEHSHSWHLYGRLSLWEGLNSNQYSHSSHLHGQSPLWEGHDLNLHNSRSRSRSRSTIFAMTPFDSKCQNHFFFTFLFSLRYDLCAWPALRKLPYGVGSRYTGGTICQCQVPEIGIPAAQYVKTRRWKSV